MQLLQHTVHRLLSSPTSHLAAVADLLIIAYFFLLRPGEYCYQREANTPFRLQDVSFRTPAGTYNAAVVDLALLDSVQLSHLRFTNQKNGDRDQDISHGLTTDPIFCPTKALIRRIHHLRYHQAPADTPLHTVYHPDGSVTALGASVFTNHLKDSLRTKVGNSTLGQQLNLLLKDITARALRAGGCMALYRSNLGELRLRQFGRWRSESMWHYLHRTGTATDAYAAQMLTNGHFTLQQHSPLPVEVAPEIEAYLASDD
jgi:hypothetical protein